MPNCLCPLGHGCVGANLHLQFRSKTQRILRNVKWLLSDSTSIVNRTHRRDYHRQHHVTVYSLATVASNCSSNFTTAVISRPTITIVTHLLETAAITLLSPTTFSQSSLPISSQCFEFLIFFYAYLFLFPSLQSQTTLTFTILSPTTSTQSSLPISSHR